MSEDSLREILGLAKKTKWNQVKKFIKFIIQKTLKKGIAYNLMALDVLINRKKQPKLSLVIKNKEEIKKIDKLFDFAHLTLYQATQNSNNLIEISQKNGTLIVLAKYLGPSLTNHELFDFSVHLDTFDDPFFTIGNGKKINSSEILEIINKDLVTKPRIKEVGKKKSKEEEEIKVEDIEVLVFEKLTEKNAYWNGTETKAYQNWKAKMKNKYRIDSGNIVYYKGKPTKKYSQYLEKLLKKKDKKTKKPIKKVNRKETSTIIDDKVISEQSIFSTLTGKNTIWNGTETKNYVAWKRKIHKKYNKDTGKNPYYRGKLTKNFQLYLKKLLKTK
ncbi:MAG: hypothetical protein ACFFDH_02500 [Promethearchaeota archaeon]